MDNQQQQKTTYVITAIVVILIAFFVGDYFGQHKGGGIASVPGIPQTINVTDEQFQPFWKVWELLSQKFVTATTTDTQERIWGAIKGLAASQGDPYTVFFPPDENELFKSDIAGNFEGVGMEIGLNKDGVMTVVAPIKDSPADKAGVKSGDQILKINDEDASTLTVDKAVALIRGQKGTSVKILFSRQGVAQPIEKTIMRDTIAIPTIQTELKSGDASSGDVAANGGTGLRSDGIFVIRLFTFTAQAPDLFRQALRDFVESGSHKLIIDLRGNPGGYLDAAWDMSSWFLPAGDVVVTEDFGGKEPSQVFRSKGYNIFGKNLDLIILVDSGSASAAEIFAGALHEHGVAELVGTKTFGKGSVQELIPITDDTSLKVTIARWLTPNGHNLSHDGLDPDVVVPITQKDIDAKNDVQMNKAVDILKQKP